MQGIGRAIALGLVVAAAHAGPAMAQDDGPSLLDCLAAVGGDTGFGRCMAEGPAIARLLRETRRDLTEARDMAANGDSDGQATGYRLRALEARLIRATTELFPDQQHGLPRSLTALVNEVAVATAQMGGLAPDTRLARHWTAETRAEIAPYTMVASAPTQPTIADTPPSPGGRSFAEILAAKRVYNSAQPVSGEQYAAVGLFQVSATAHLLDRNLGGIVTVQNRIADYRAQLQAVNEVVSPDLEQLDRDLIDFILHHDNAGNA